MSLDTDSEKVETPDLHQLIQNDIKNTDHEEVLEFDEFSSIPTFFQDSVVFITGVTGFLGHVLLSKLLRSCPGIRKIYILMREKRSKTVNERFQELCNAPIFGKFKTDQQDYFSKVTPIKGDCLKPNLGICENDRKLLQTEVNVVFHVAATVRFDAPLKTAVNINVRSTRDLLDIARSMQQLKAFVHVSTAFSFCAERKIIEEKLYEPPLPASNLIAVIDQLDDSVIDQITPALLRHHPNTYVFTKAISEGLFSTTSLNLPIAIFRPAIVISTAKEPIPGWINNTYGPTGIVAAAGLGLMRTLNADKNCKANIVPCDYVINALIASAWYTAKKWRVHQDKSNTESFLSRMPIFNYSSTETTKCITWSEFMHENEILEPEFPYSDSLWAYSLTLNKYKFMNQLYTLFLHSLPAHIVDAAATIYGKKPKLVESYNKIHKLANVISYFSTREWKIPNKNVQNMWNMLSDEDKTNFDFNLETINWREYFRHHMTGIRQYILKDNLDTLPFALKKRKKLIFTHYSLVLTIICLFIFCLNTIIKYLFFK